MNPAEPPRPGYRQIADDLRDAIKTGRYSPGDELPPHRALAETYDVNPVTIRRATDMLKTEGLIRAERQRLTVRTDRPPVVFWLTHTETTAGRRSSPWDVFVQAMTEQGRKPDQTIQVAIVTAPDEVAVRLDLDPGATVAVRRRLRTVDTQPLDINDSYYPIELATGTEILTPGDIARGVGNVLRDLGHEQVRFIDEITARMPTPEETARLGIAAGVPVTEHVRTGHTTERPVRVTVTIAPGDRVKLLYEVDA